MSLNEKFDAELIDKIKEEHLKPKPKWRFLLKNIVIWVGLIWFLLFGGLATSLIIFMLRYDGLELIMYSHKLGLKILLMAVPIFWLLILILFTVLIYFNYRHTKKGYRYPVYLILPISIISSLVLGAVFFQAGFGEKIDDMLSRRPMYERFINPGIKSWSSPEEGRLSGILFDKLDEDSYFLIDRNDKQWSVIIKTDDMPDFIPPMGMPVRLIGEKIGDKQFKASVLMPIKPGRGSFDKVHHMPPPPEFFMNK